MEQHASALYEKSPPYLCVCAANTKKVVSQLELVFLARSDNGRHALVCLFVRPPTEQTD